MWCERANRRCRKKGVRRALRAWLGCSFRRVPLGNKDQVAPGESLGFPISDFRFRILAGWLEGWVLCADLFFLVLLSLSLLGSAGRGRSHRVRGQVVKSELRFAALHFVYDLTPWARPPTAAALPSLDTCYLILGTSLEAAEPPPACITSQTFGRRRGGTSRRGGGNPGRGWRAHKSPWVGC